MSWFSLICFVLLSTIILTDGAKGDNARQESVKLARPAEAARLIVEDPGYVKFLYENVDQEHFVCAINAVIKQATNQLHIDQLLFELTDLPEIDQRITEVLTDLHDSAPDLSMQSQLINLLAYRAASKRAKSKRTLWREYQAADGDHQATVSLALVSKWSEMSLAQRETLLTDLDARPDTVRMLFVRLLFTKRRWQGHSDLQAFPRLQVVYGTAALQDILEHPIEDLFPSHALATDADDGYTTAEINQLAALIDIRVQLPRSRSNQAVRVIPAIYKLIGQYNWLWVLDGFQTGDIPKKQAQHIARGILALHNGKSFPTDISPSPSILLKMFEAIDSPAEFFKAPEIAARALLKVLGQKTALSSSDQAIVRRFAKRAEPRINGLASAILAEAGLDQDSRSSDQRGTCNRSFSL